LKKKGVIKLIKEKLNKTNKIQNSPFSTTRHVWNTNGLEMRSNKTNIVEIEAIFLRRCHHETAENTSLRCTKEWFCCMQ
jgi:hypothetical protein